MGIHNLQTEMLHTRPQKKGKIRQVFVLTSLLILTALLGTTTGVIAFNWTNWSDSNQGNTSSNPNISNNKMVARSITTPNKKPITITIPATPTPTLPPTPHSSVPLIYNGNTYLPEVALSFDDGPSAIYTQQVLAILKQYQVPATFFCIGRQVQQYPDLVKMEYNQTGIVIGNHTWSHPDLPLLTRQQITTQIQDTSTAIEQATGKQPIFFRPPYGAINAQVRSVATSLKLTSVLWNDDTRDWARPGVKSIINTAVGTVGDGSIILMHDGGGDRSETVAALPTIIKDLRSHGYQIVPLQKMIDDLQVLLPNVKGPTQGTATPTVLPPDGIKPNKPSHSGGPGE